jgi:hypothetical protein
VGGGGQQGAMQPFAPGHFSFFFLVDLSSRGILGDPCPSSAGPSLCLWRNGFPLGQNGAEWGQQAEAAVPGGQAQQGDEQMILCLPVQIFACLSFALLALPGLPLFDLS